LQAAKAFPVSPIHAVSKVVYSPHAYGPGVFLQPYFAAPNFPKNMPSIWHTQWGHLVDEGVAPVLIGEWGGRNGGQDHVWQVAMGDYLRTHEIGSFYWWVMRSLTWILVSAPRFHTSPRGVAQVLEP
jgi:endoglucanase